MCWDQWLKEANIVTSVAAIVDVFGGSAGLNINEASLEALRERVRSGLPYGAMESLMHQLELGTDELGDVVGIPRRTLARRKRLGSLSPEESDRLLRIGRIAANAVEVLGHRDKAAQWLHRPNRALGGVCPLELLDTDLGTRQVEEILGRIEHGVFS